MEVLFISGIFLSVFIAVLLLTKKQKALTDKILAFWILIIAIHLLGYHFNQLGYWERYPDLIGVTAPIPLLHGPLLYLYCLYALTGDRRFRPGDYLHFIPALGAYLVMMKFFLFYSAEDKLKVDRGEIDDFRTFSIVLLIAILISGLGYAIISYLLTIKHKHKIDRHYSYREGISLRWLRNCILAIGLVFLSAIAVYFLRDLLGIPFGFNAEYIIYTLLIVYIFYIGYFGIKHENIFVHTGALPTPVDELSEKGEKYKHSGMNPGLAGELYDKLVLVMEQDKPYLEPRLSLAELAGRMGISPNHLSQVINQAASVNFHDFVNRYRVEEFLQNATGKRHYSLLALALESGFNSKSSFNTIFKKHKGISPSEYLSKRERKD